MAFILTTLSLDAIGFGLIMPVMPDLMRELTGSDLGQAALWGGLMTGGFALMQFLFGPVIGNLSDRFGRKPVLLLSLAVLSGDYMVMALAGTVWLVFAARLVSGVASSTYGTAMAYIADISTPAEKAQRFGLRGAGFGIGFVLGPAIGGLLAEYGTRAPFVAASVVAALNVVFGLFIMRESLSPSERRPFEWRKANPFGAFSHIGRLPGQGRFMAIYTAHEFSFIVYPVIWSYYCAARFGWGPGQIGLSLAMFGVSFGLMQGVGIRPVLRYFSRLQAMMMGLFGSIIAFSMLIWIESGTLALVSIPLSSLSGLFMPALRAEMSDAVSAREQGALQGALASLHALAAIGAPFLYTFIFASFSGAGAWLDLPGMVFVIPMLLSAASLGVLIALRR